LDGAESKVIDLLCGHPANDILDVGLVELQLLERFHDGVGCE
jgi:hypothetical protein